MRHLLFSFLATLLPLTVSGQENNTEGKRIFPVEEARNSTVIFTFGQSNAANHGQTAYAPRHKVMNYHDGIIYEGRDPLVGPTGNGGSVWTRLADKMIESGMAESVTIVPIAVGATEISEWCKGGRLNNMMTATIDRLVEDKLIPDYILWHQGESDNISNTSTEDYMKMFESIRNDFRDRGISAPILVAVASYHPHCISKDKGNDKNIRQAQKMLARKHNDIFIGPDTDKLDKCYYRHDGVHMSDIGLDRHSDGWLRCLRKVRRK